MLPIYVTLKSWDIQETKRKRATCIFTISQTESSTTMKRLPEGIRAPSVDRKKRRKKATSHISTEQITRYEPYATSSSVFFDRYIIKVIVDHIPTGAWNTILRLTPVTYEVSSCLLCPSGYLESIPFDVSTSTITVTSASPIESFVNCLKAIRDDVQRPFTIKEMFHNAIRWQRSDMVRQCLDTGAITIDDLEDYFDPHRSVRSYLPFTMEIVREIMRTIGTGTPSRFLESLFKRSIPVGSVIFRTRSACDLIDRNEAIDKDYSYPDVIVETTWFTENFSDLKRAERFVRNLEWNIHSWTAVQRKMLHLWNRLLKNGVKVEVIFKLFRRKEIALYLVRVVMEQGFKMGVVRQREGWLATLKDLLCGLDRMLMSGL